MTADPCVLLWMLVAAMRTGFTFEVPVRSPARQIRILHHRDEGVRILPRVDVFMTRRCGLTYSRGHLRSIAHWRNVMKINRHTLAITLLACLATPSN